MAMVPFITRFPDLGAREMRTITYQGTDGLLPPGEYGFLELYCDERGCDCRRVLLQVVSAPPKSRIWANLSFGWEDAEYYRKRNRTGEELLDSKLFLDPINEQTEYAATFLTIFEEYSLPDEVYVERLRRHYAMFKKKVNGLEKMGMSRPPGRR